MNDFVVPTVQVEVEALLSDGQQISGCVFLPSGTPHHAGPELPSEWLNEPTASWPSCPAATAPGPTCSTRPRSSA